MKSQKAGLTQATLESYEMLTNQAAVDKHRVHARVVARGFSTRLCQCRCQWGFGVMLQQLEARYVVDGSELRRFHPPQMNKTWFFIVGYTTNLNW